MRSMKSQRTAKAIHIHAELDMNTDTNVDHVVALQEKSGARQGH